MHFFTDRPYQIIDIVMLTTMTNCLASVINKQSHGLECNFGNNCMAMQLFPNCTLIHVIKYTNTQDVRK